MLSQLNTTTWAGMDWTGQPALSFIRNVVLLLLLFFFLEILREMTENKYTNICMLKEANTKTLPSPLFAQFPKQLIDGTPRRTNSTY